MLAKLLCNFFFSYGTGSLTRTFIDRVFQECLTFEGEIDYKTYLDFVLALENRHEPQSQHYLFRILDIHGKGFLDTFCLRYYFKVSKKYLSTPYFIINFE